MDARQAIAEYDNTAKLGAEVRATIADPPERQRMYALMEAKPALGPFHGLVLAMFEQEMLLRNVPWQGKTDLETEDAATGLYRCAFLLHQIGDPEDTFILWQAKCLDMDAYVMLGAHYFVGAGIDDTITFLEQSARENADRILAYVKTSFDAPRAADEHRAWEAARRADPGNVWL